MVHKIAHNDGLYLILGCEIDGKPVTIVSIYLPPSLGLEAVRELLVEVNCHIGVLGNSDVIWCGDFNSVLDRNLDATKVRTSPYSSSVSAFMEENELTDVWRVFHPQVRRFTFFSNIYRSLSHLDFFLASATFLTRILDADIWPAYCSDHSAITLQFSLSDNDRGKGFFRIPNFVLRDPSYCRLVRNCIAVTLNENVGADDALLWDVVKSQIRGTTIHFLADSKRYKKCRIEAVEQEISEATLQRDMAESSDMIAHYSAKVKFLQIELDDIFMAINIRDKEFRAAQKFYDTERSTKYYFHSFGYQNQSIKLLREGPNTVVSSDKEILSVCHRFYDSLYRQETGYALSSPVLHWNYLQNIPCNRINDIDHQLLSAPISCEELYDSLKAMSVQKSLGEDGLTVEFYRAFWSEVKNLVHNSVQHAFRVGRLSVSQRRGVLRLLPKSHKDLLLVSNWRPITLLNVDYKLITKNKGSFF